jgi:hypothetical protein
MSVAVTAADSHPDGRASVNVLLDIHGATDALYRFAAGQDLRRRELFESAFSPDATLDFIQPARLFGVQLPVFVGREAIADTIMGTTAPLVTTHSITNPRVEVAGDHARLTALVEAQHVLRAEPLRRLLLKNFYFVDLARAGSGWLIERMRIENAWWAGDPSVLFPDVLS